MPLTPEEVLKNIALREAEPVIEAINKALEEATKLPIELKLNLTLSLEAMTEVNREFFPAGWDVVFSTYLENTVPVTKVNLYIRKKETPQISAEPHTEEVPAHKESQDTAQEPPVV